MHIQRQYWKSMDWYRKGLALYNPETEHFIRIGEQESPLTHRIYDIQQFNENELWVATEFGGIAIINLSKSLFNTAESIHYIQAGDNEYYLNNSTVRCLYQDSHQNIWLEHGEEVSIFLVPIPLCLNRSVIHKIHLKVT